MYTKLKLKQLGSISNSLPYLLLDARPTSFIDFSIIKKIRDFYFYIFSVNLSVNLRYTNFFI